MFMRICKWSYRIITIHLLIIILIPAYTCHNFRAVRLIAYLLQCYLIFTCLRGGCKFSQYFYLIYVGHFLNAEIARLLVGGCAEF